MTSFFDYSDEIKHAIHHQTPILALESTVLSHGLPYPVNLETALALEQISRDHGAAPATIAIIDGKIKIGISHDELMRLCTDKTTTKASTRDLSHVLSHKLSAGTTVAATSHCAALAGIKIFATGGIGGVHRGDSLDISADLIELSRTPIAVVCAGAKAILDLPRTLEYLETYSIPVIGFKTDTFPAFYTRTSPYQLSSSVEDVRTLAVTLKTHWQLALPTGMLIVNPIPINDEIPMKDIEHVIAHALAKAAKKQIIGKAMTPFLLSEVANSTQGKSIQANIALLKNNVRLGAELAAQFSKDS